MKKDSVKKPSTVRQAHAVGTLLAGTAALAMAAVLSGCGTESEDGSAGLFRYDAAKGECRDARKQPGYNPYTLRELRATHNAECVDLSGLDLILLKNDAITFANDSLVGWNFKGARFNESGLHVNHIIDGQLQGADFTGSRFGYAQTTGVIDKFTKPPDGNCTVTGDRIDCWQ